MLLCEYVAEAPAVFTAVFVAVLILCRQVPGLTTAASFQALSNSSFTNHPTTVLMTAWEN